MVWKNTVPPKLARIELRDARIGTVNGYDPIVEMDDGTKVSTADASKIGWRLYEPFDNDSLGG